MHWVPYKNWQGAVNGKQLRVSVNCGSGVAAYGPSLSAIHLPVGTVCRINNVLPADARKMPGYVKYSGYDLPLAYALEVEVNKSATPDHIWKQIINAHVTEDFVQLVIDRKTADMMEIEVG